MASSSIAVVPPAEPAPQAQGSASAGGARADDAGSDGLSRAGSLLERAGTAATRVGSNLHLQRANTLPTEDKDLLHAATMPMTFDIDADRPCCFGLWKVQQFVGFALGLVLFLAFLAGGAIGTYPHANRMLGLTLMCASFWIFEVMPVYMTALLPMVLIPFLEIASSEYIATAYWNWISMLVVATYLVDIALEHVHLPRRMALALLLKAGIVRPEALLACFMGLCWLLSMFLNSIAVTLIVTPFAIGLMNAAEEQALVAAEAATDQAQEAGQAEAGAAEAQGRREAERAQTFATGLLIGIAYSASAGGIATITGALPNYFLAAETMLTGHISWVSWFAFALPISVATGLLAYLVLYLRYVRRLRFQGIPRHVLEREYSDFIAEHGPVSRDEVLVGGLQILQIILLILRPYTFSLWFTTPHGEGLVNDATVAMIPALLLFVIPSQQRPGESLLTWPAVHDKFDFGLLLLIGGSIAINYGFANSGLSVALGDGLADLIPRVSPFTLNLVIVISVTLASQVLSSISTASTMLPVLSSACVQAMVNPLCLMLPATVAASFSFLLPTASPPNVVVLAKSQDLGRALRFRDFFTNGLALSVAAILVGSALSLAMRWAVFGADDALPRWACEAASGSCMWVDIQGVVHGRDVASQACVVDLVSGTMCRLWNGTSVDVTAYM